MQLKVKNTFIIAVSLILLSSLAQGFESVKVSPREVIVGKKLTGWKFSSDEHSWTASSQCHAVVKNGIYEIVTLGEDPSIVSPVIELKGPLVIRMRLRIATAGSGEIFWTTKESPSWDAAKSCSFRLIHDNKWHEYKVLVDTPEIVTRLRFDPGAGIGKAAIDRIELFSGRQHPLEVVSIKQDYNKLNLKLHNHDSRELQVTVNGIRQLLSADSDSTFKVEFVVKAAFEVLPIKIKSPGLPVIKLDVCIYNPDVKQEWLVRNRGQVTAKIASDGSGAKILLAGREVAIIAPLFFSEGKIPRMKCDDISHEILKFKGDGCTASLELVDEGLHIVIKSNRIVEGPIFRVLGRLEQGLLAGAEYLGKGERSSSTLDMEIPDHWRVTPNPLWITMPLMACVTDKVSAALLWNDMSLQPVYAVPNFLDGTSDNRMAIRGKNIDVTLLIKPAIPLEEIILWAIQKHPLPPLPENPRTDEQQKELLIRAFDQSIAAEGGWGHAAEARWARRPYADIASSIGRLTGKWRRLSEIVSDGAQIRNDAIYFMTGNAKKWLQIRALETKTLLAQQKADGSFRYQGAYSRGHYEDTASGYSAWRAMLLLEYARLTGDDDALKGGLACLEFMKKFRTPRGAQTHELSLHTPDLLASAYLVRAYILGYELTQKTDYLAAARKWAISGLPFTYQWSKLPIMAYSTIPVFGATSWREPNWIGLPVQWCGVVYAYGLTMLDKYDKTLDWKKLAKGILISAQQMQYPDGELAGCLPDFFLLREQRRAGPSINPAIIVSLQLAIDGRLDSLAVATDDRFHVISPFPVAIKNGTAIIEAVKGIEYQILVNCKKIINVHSIGTDVLKLDGE